MMSRSRAFGKLATATLLFHALLAIPHLAAQTSTGQIYGTVADTSGGVLPGATVTATHTRTGVARTTVTQAGGAYNFSDLAVGPYSVTVELQSFGTSVTDNVVVAVAQSTRVDVSLSVGTHAETVHVRRQGDARGHPRRQPRRGGGAAPHRGDAAQRPQLPAAVLVRPRRHGQLPADRPQGHAEQHAGRAAEHAERQRHPQHHERGADRRRAQQRSGPEHRRDRAGARCDRGVQDPDQHVPERLRPGRRLGHQHRDQVGRLGPQWFRLLLRPQRRVRLAQRVPAREGEAVAPPVRRHPRRAAAGARRQDLLLRDLRRAAPRARRAAQQRRADGGPEARGLQRARNPAAQPDPGLHHQQHHRSRPVSTRSRPT